jgi:putative transposase
MGKIEGLTKIKEAILEQEYNRFNQICKQVQECRNNDVEPQWKWFKDKNTHCSYISVAIMSFKIPFIKLNNQPLYLRNDASRLEQRETKISKYWLKVPTKQRRQFWVAVNIPEYYQNKMNNFTFCDSQIVKKDNEWFAHITIEKEITLKTEYKDVLGIDLGSRRPASVVQLSNGLTRYYGKEIRRIRGHYFYLRKKLGQKKAKRTIKKIGKTENRKVNDQLHKISRKIVNMAKESNSIIVLGNLKHIRKNSNKGRKFNRKLSTMPFAKLSNYIEYKANLEGIKVIKVSERNTSKTCSKCGQIGKRNKGLFKCKCGYEDNADRNGAINIAKRGLGEMSSLGASTTIPITKGYANIITNPYLK